MSTRCVINFSDGPTRLVAKVYRHCDGYPDGDSGILADLQRFFADVESQTNDTRFDDAAYLAAKYVVWQASRNAYTYNLVNGKMRRVKAKPLDFLSVGILVADPGDIEYVYTVDCDRHDASGRPVVTHRRLVWEVRK